MREIKFMAWDKENKKLISWRDICSYYNLLSMLDHVARDYDRYEVMQYTGLHDKNGKEIYEGDVLEFGDKSGKASVAYNQNKAQYQLSKLKHKSSNIIIKNAQIDLNTNCISKDELKVIGNIYENPELLGVEQ